MVGVSWLVEEMGSNIFPPFVRASQGIIIIPPPKHNTPNNVRGQLYEEDPMSHSESEEGSFDEDDADGIGIATPTEASQEMFLPPSTKIPSAPTPIPSLNHIEANRAPHKGPYLPPLATHESRRIHTHPIHDVPPLRSSGPTLYSLGPTGDLVGDEVAPLEDAAKTSLPASLCDPYTGMFMDDGSLLSCGHSFGADSIKHMLEIGACMSCGVPMKKEDVIPNYTLRSVVQAFRREGEHWRLDSLKVLKQRRERAFNQDRFKRAPLASALQFPYSVNDKVVIKGNKRTPERFFGHQAVVTSQCLNGWYMVRMLDNGETVKLQYRSLMKLGEKQTYEEIQGEKSLDSNWP